jgi:hypothetical protein
MSNHWESSTPVLQSAQRIKTSLTHNDDRLLSLISAKGLNLEQPKRTSGLDPKSAGFLFGDEVRQLKRYFAAGLNAG